MKKKEVEIEDSVEGKFDEEKGFAGELEEKTEQLDAKEKQLDIIKNKLNGNAAIERANDLDKKKRKSKKSKSKNKLEEKRQPMPEPTHTVETTKPKKEVSKEIADADTKLAQGFLEALKDGPKTTHQIRKLLNLPSDWRCYNDSRIKNFCIAQEKAGLITIDHTSRIFVYKLKSE